MTIKVYKISPDGEEVNLLYKLEEDEEYTGVFADGETPINARAGKEGDGFVLTHPSEGIAGKKSFQNGDIVALTNDLELEAA